jgi:hypothetical protein
MKAWLNKLVDFWQREWLKIIIFSYVSSLFVLILLNHGYNNGLLCVNIAEYLFMGIAFILLTCMTIDYARKIYIIVKRDKK